MSQAADEIYSRFLDKAEEVLEELVSDVAEDLRKAVSIPVDRSTRPPTRSKPGEFPRRDSGRFKGSITSVVYRAGGNLRGVVSTNTPYDEILNRTRPFALLIQAKWQYLAQQRFAIAFH